MGGIRGLYIGNVAITTLLVIGFLIYIRKTLGLPLYDGRINPIRELRANRDVIAASLMFAAGAVTLSMSFLIARYSVLSLFGAAEAGLLQGVLSLSLSIGLVLNPTNGLYLTPIMNRNISAELKIRTALEYQKRLTVVAGLIGMVVVLFPGTLLKVLFSGRFTATADWVFLFVIAQVLVQLAAVYQALLVGLDDLKSFTLITCSGHLSIGLCAWLLVPRWGIAGVGIALVISSAMIGALSFLRLRKRYAFSLPSGLGGMMGYGVLTLVAVGWGGRAHPEWTATSVLIRSGVCGLFALSLVFFLSKQERSVLYGIWNRLRTEASGQV